MKIVLATGIFPPEIGGPAQYSLELSKALTRQGHTPVVATYGSLKKLPPFIRHLAFTVRLLRLSAGSDAIIAFDTYSVGLPAYLVSALTGKRIVVRIGGDFLWEGYVRRTNELIPLPELYKQRRRWGIKEWLVYWLVKLISRRATFAFSCEWIRDMWIREYGLRRDRAAGIENAIGERLAGAPPQQKNFLFYTRQIALKNGAAFKRAFARAKEVQPDIVLEEGVVPHNELIKRMQSCYAVVLPSISDVTPNYIIDAIRCGKPFLLTKYSGYAERFKDLGVIVDPLDEENMARGVLELADTTICERLSENIARFHDFRTYDDIAHDFLTLI